MSAVSISVTVFLLGLCSAAIATALLSEVREQEQARRDERQRERVRRAVLQADQQLAAKHRQARMEMNRRAGQSWRNLAESSTTQPKANGGTQFLRISAPSATSSSTRSRWPRM